MGNGVFVQIQKTLNTKWARILKRNCEHILYKNSAVKIQRVNCVLGHSTLKIVREYVQKFACPFRDALK